MSHTFRMPLSSSPRPTIGRALLAIAGVVVAGACSDPEPVPFGLEQGRPSAPAATDAPAAPLNLAPLENAQNATAGIVVPITTPATGVTIEGAHLPFDGRGCVLWSGDLEPDGDRDGILLSHDETGFRLAYAIHQGGRFDPWQEFARFETGAPAPDGERCCEGVQLEVLGEQILHATVRPCGTAREGQTSATASTVHWLASLDRRPRLEAELRIVAADSAPTLAFRGEDRNADGRTDVVASKTMGDAAVELVWLNHASGFAFQAGQVDATVSKVLEPEWTKLESDDAADRPQYREAMVRARSVLALYRAVCEGGSLSCARSSGAGEAVALEAAALARLGSVGQAVRGFESFTDPAYRTTFRARRMVRRAIEANAVRIQTVVNGPAMTQPAEAGRLSALAFLSRGELLLRGAAPKVWTVDTDTLRDANPTDGNRELLDPSGHHGVLGIEAPCPKFTLLRIAGRGTSPSPSPQGHPLPLDGSPSHCRQERTGGAPPAGTGLRVNGWLLLGWAPQGILAERFGELRLVPVAASGVAVEAARTLPPGSPVPAPVPPGAMEPSGDHYVVPSALGLLWRSRAARKTTLLIPENWEDENVSTAVSPDGRRFAYTAAERVYVFDVPSGT